MEMMQAEGERAACRGARKNEKAIDKHCRDGGHGSRKRPYTLYPIPCMSEANDRTTTTPKKMDSTRGRTCTTPN